MGLGSAFYVPLLEARSRAAEIRLSIAKGADPLEAKTSLRESAGSERRPKQVTFKSLAEEFIRTNEAGWSNAKHREQWRRSLELFAYPTIGHMPVAEIGVDDVLTILKPIWATKAEQRAASECGLSVSCRRPSRAVCARRPIRRCGGKTCSTCCRRYRKLGA